jgi:hypothetical protein
MTAPEALRNEDFDRLTQQLLPSIAKELLSLGVDERNPAVLVDNDHGIGRRFK